MKMTQCDYIGLYHKARGEDSTREDRLKLLEWCEQYLIEDWNGESYKLNSRESLKPLYKIYKELDGVNYIIVDAKFIND